MKSLPNKEEWKERLRKRNERDQEKEQDNFWKIGKCRELQDLADRGRSNIGAESEERKEVTSEQFSTIQ